MLLPVVSAGSVDVDEDDVDVVVSSVPTGAPDGVEHPITHTADTDAAHRAAEGRSFIAAPYQSVRDGLRALGRVAKAAR